MYFYEERINRIIKEIKEYVYPKKMDVTQFKMKQGPYSAKSLIKLNCSENDFDDWKEFKSGERWGKRNTSFLFSTTVTIPKEFAEKVVVFEVKTGREGEWDALNPQFMVFINGRLVHGLDVNHREVILSEKAVSGETFNILMHAYSGMQEGTMELSAKIAVLDRGVEKFYYDLKVPYNVAVLLENGDKRRIDIIGFLNETINMLDLRKPFSLDFYNSVKKADEYLQKEFYENYCGHNDFIATCVGHTHIDVAWLWPLAQTREKTARTFSTMLSLMDQYPEYIFMSSQPQLYKFVKEDYPEIYEKIKKEIKEGKWEPEGGMWLEADCNISSGESLVRQVLFGKRFFQEEFGIDSKLLWLPDVFGYSAALPQIMKKSGIDYFMTTKISWNEYNKLPYDTFKWRGIDGTEILTHFITTRSKDFKHNDYITTYNGVLAPSQIIGAWERYQQKDLNNDVLVSYGYGDGGGGPTKEMLENASRMEKGIPGCPKVKLGKSLDYFKRLEANVKENKKLPKWVGELYLEYHRGTYTSMARNKKFNRKCEFMYQDAEMLSVMKKYAAKNGEYPKDKINAGWEIILLNQFHDILPGSSIKEVYEDSKEQYLAIMDVGKELINSAIMDISSAIDLKEESVVVFNQLGIKRSDIVEIELPCNCKTVEIIDDCGKILPSQFAAVAVDCIESNVNRRNSETAEPCEYKDNNNKDDNNNINNCKVVFFAEDVPAKGYKAFRIKQSQTKDEVGSPSFDMCKSNANENEVCPIEINIEKDSENKIKAISNKYFNIKFDESYNLMSIFDKENSREIIKDGKKANVIQAFEDKPHNYDAWDINIYYQEKMWEVNNVESAQIVENGPVRTALKIVRRFLDSKIIQYIYVYNDLQRIDFKTIIDWKEKQILLKAAFPVDIHSDKAAFEIQYGNVERPTHWNTSWDLARFESVAHKWVDLSEDDYGVSLLNDSKYGHDIKDSVMRLTLLKSATYPNVDADREVHEFIYSLYPHKGDWKEGDTVKQAYFLNCPMYYTIQKAHSGSLPSEFSMVCVDKENVIIEVVKGAEDSEDIIIRVYECYNRRTTAKITLFTEILEVWDCDLLENNNEKLCFEGNSFKFNIKPYEIKTFKLKVRK